jgi:hypothetical protein
MASAPDASAASVASQGTDADGARSRALARLCGTFHNITYYTPLIREFAALGITRYWHAYMGYRSAPLGNVPATVVTSVFYNFAPRMVEAAIPSVWDHVTPAEAMVRRDDIGDRAVRAAFGDGIDAPDMARAADLARRAIEDCDVAGRALFAAHRALPWPEPPHLQLHHACTLWREHRGDSHNAALVAAEVDGLECHVLLGAKGVVTQPVIEKIRGWTAEEWAAAVARLADRGLVTPDGGPTPAGHVYREDIEATTDRLVAEPRRRLGPDGCDELISLLRPLVTHLVETGAVSGTWPPKGLFAAGAAPPTHGFAVLPHRPAGPQPRR